MLALLHAHAGKPVASGTILQQVWCTKGASSHVLDTHLWRLRKKIGEPAGPQWIGTVPGSGYVLRCEPGATG